MLLPAPPTQVTGSLTPVEAQLLSVRLASLERCLEPGLGRLNWNNRGIDAFVAATTKAIQEFAALHHSVQKSGGIIKKLVLGLAAVKLVPDLPAGARRACSGVCMRAGSAGSKRSCRLPRTHPPVPLPCQS